MYRKLAQVHQILTSQLHQILTIKKYGALNVFKKVIQNVTDDQKSLPTEKFDFTAKFGFPAGTDANTLGGVKDKDGNGVTLDATGQCTFQLGNGENMKFTGLPVGTTITVTEAAKANYKRKCCCCN